MECEALLECGIHDRCSCYLIVYYRCDCYLIVYCRCYCHLIIIAAV